MKTTKLKQTQWKNQTLKDIAFLHVRNLAARLISLPDIAEGSGRRVKDFWVWDI